ncbi:vacuolar protein-sorting-associated protein [Canna indica]|uniref:Vacuolar protein-sorting-associated protein n=1 Tax=Canna indica TaxID=4628 RepID=A0AAQ3QLR3_9LILI|nr:vacuolar protein-sorting-associated protein [Canna indica]
MFSSSILLQFLACVLYNNWWPMLSALMYVVLPMPCLFFGDGSTRFLTSREGGGWINAAKFLTGASAMGSIAIPAILRHAHLIETGAMLIEFTSFFILVCTILYFHRKISKTKIMGTSLALKYSLLFHLSEQPDCFIFEARSMNEDNAQEWAFNFGVTLGRIVLIWQKFSHLFRFAQRQSVSIAEAKNVDNDGIFQGWNLVFTTYVNEAHLLELAQELVHVQDSSGVDSFFWKWSARRAFTVNSLYGILTYRGIKDVFHPFIWQVKLPPKVLVFI